MTEPRQQQHVEPSPGFATRQRRTTNIALITIAVLLSIGAMLVAEAVLMPLAGALLLSLLFRPLVRWLHGWRVPRPVSAVFIVLLLFALIVGPVSAIWGPALRWFEDAPRTFERIEMRINELTEPIQPVVDAAEELSGEGDEPTEDPAENPYLHMPDGDRDEDGKVDEYGPGDQTPFRLIGRGARTWFGPLMTQTGYTLLSLLLMMVLTFFLLLSGNAVMFAVVSLQRSLGARRRTVRAFLRAERDVSGYLVNLTLINVGVGIVTGLMCWAVGLPAPIMLGLVGGLFNFVPYAGAIAAGFVIFMTALMTADEMSQVLLAPLLFAGINIVEGYILSPMIHGERLKLNPLAILIGLLLLGWAWGVAGALMAVPLLVCFRIVCDYVPQLSWACVFLKKHRPARKRGIV